MSETVKIPLNFGKVAIIDAADFDIVSQYNWNAVKGTTGWYAVAVNERYRIVRMHRLLMKSERGVLVDHRNGDGLDNRRSNLRHSTVAQNRHNSRKTERPTTSTFKGVNFCRDKPRHRPWRAKIKIGGKSKFLGYYATETQAALAYDTAAKEHHGDFVRTNFN